MNISFSPMRSDDKLTLHKSGDVLTVNGDAFDFSPLPDGATLPRVAVAGDWLASDVERIDGTLHLTVILPHEAQATQAVLFPETIDVVDDGEIFLATIVQANVQPEATP